MCIMGLYTTICAHNKTEMSPKQSKKKKSKKQINIYNKLNTYTPLFTMIQCFIYNQEIHQLQCNGYLLKMGK